MRFKLLSSYNNGSRGGRMEVSSCKSCPGTSQESKHFVGTNVSDSNTHCGFADRPTPCHKSVRSNRSDIVRYASEQSKQSRLASDGKASVEMQVDECRKKFAFVRGAPQRKSVMKSFRRMIKKHLRLGRKEQRSIHDIDSIKSGNNEEFAIEPSTSMYSGNNSSSKKIFDSQSKSSYSLRSLTSQNRAENASIRSKRDQSLRLYKSASKASIIRDTEESLTRASPPLFIDEAGDVLHLNGRTLFDLTTRRFGEDDNDSGVDSPIESRLAFESLPPCRKGLMNVGNTCYINSVLQCLAAVEPLAKYFVLKKFAKDLREKNQIQLLNSHQYGTNGLITTAFANLMRSLWLNEPTDSSIRYFRSLIGHFNDDYRMSSQQDAQEFLVWVLDKVHEDLNVATSRKYREIKCRGSEEDIAETARNNHLSAHCSIVTYLFGAQFRSSIQCKRCNFTRLTFDPYACVSLQVPQGNLKSVFVTLATLNNGKRSLIRYGIKVEKLGRILDIMECVCSEANVAFDRLIISKLDASDFHPLFPSLIISNELASSEISAVEVPKISLIRNEICIVFVIVECESYGKHLPRLRLTNPFVCVVQRYASYRTLCCAMLDSILPSTERDINVHGSIISALTLRILEERVCYLNPSAPMPLNTSSVQWLIDKMSIGCNMDIPVLPVVMECADVGLNSLIIRLGEKVTNHQSCAILEEEKQSGVATLGECIDEFTRAESIEWHCDNCFGNDAEKILKFRSLPKILVFHLKRFRQMRDGSTVKLDRGVNFPIENLDMSPYVYHCGSTPLAVRKSSHIDNDLGDGEKPPPLLSNGANDTAELYINTSMNTELLYDLFAIVHHSGDKINSGHYTAMTKNVINRKWFHFDDHIVRPIDRIELADMSTAYLLFYENKAMRKQFSHSSSGHSSAESDMPEHWFSRICNDCKKSNTKLANSGSSEPRFSGVVYNTRLQSSDSSGTPQPDHKISIDHHHMQSPIRRIWVASNSPQRLVDDSPGDHPIYGTQWTTKRGSTTFTNTIV